MIQTLKRTYFLFALVLTIAALTGCAVGPHYKRPTVDVPGTYRESTPAAPVPADAKDQQVNSNQLKLNRLRSL
jgi:uncharacterized lipoprotein